MNTDSYELPWNCTDTYGRSLQNDPGQAHLCQWPLKLRLISPLAPHFHKAHLMLAADCAAFSYIHFHSILKDKVLIIGCPELDGPVFFERLKTIVRVNDILSITVARMDAPCCGSLAGAVISAVRDSRKNIPIQITTIFAEGEIVE
jgi:hypothetical protein